MKTENYYIGLDIGTDSVGYAVTNEAYELCKFRGEPMWGVTLFDKAQTAAKRRGFRTARRRYDRRKQRVRLIGELFAAEIAKVDEGFFKRIKESYHYPENDNDKIRLFDTYDEQKKYDKTYPTIHHLIVELMNNAEPHDARLVYLACAWLASHRGHFLSEVDKNNVGAVTDFESVYRKLAAFITRDSNYSLPWRDNVQLDTIANALKSKSGIRKKEKALTEALFGATKAPKTVDEQHEYNYELVIKLLCGGKVGLKELFDKEEYADLEEKSVALNMDDEKLAGIMQSIGDDAEFISVLKSVYDWSVLVDVLKDRQTISEAKVEIYEQHAKDLITLKKFVKKYINVEKYKEIFKAVNSEINYVAYIGKNKSEKGKSKKSADKEAFCKYILSAFKSVTPDEEDAEEYDKMISRLESRDFMPKQVDSDNRTIPYQLYWFELNKILENAKEYLPFLKEADEDGITGAEKVLSVFEFRVPYYVGPLKEKSDSKFNHWMIRKAEGRIYPWNFDAMVDLDASENAFINGMTNTCTYIPNEDVLPKCSLIYCAFEVLNEINNIKINGKELPVNVKQEIYSKVFLQSYKVTPNRIRDYLKTNNYISEDSVISGLDTTVKSSLKPFIQFKNLMDSGLISESDAEKIIHRATYSEDKSRFSLWLQKEYPDLPESELKYISGLKFKDFGRFSRRLLCEIEGVDNVTGEYYPSIIRAMWETNCNFMQLKSDRFTFAKNIEKIVKEYYDPKPKSISDRLEEMRISNSVKRPIIRTLDILKDVVKVQGHAPKRIFIEMARGASEEQKGKRTKSRLDQLKAIYEQAEADARELSEDLHEMSEKLNTLSEANNKLQNDKLFLYYLQLGKCLYTGKPIDIESVIRGDGTYNIEHIYPQSFVKDDSIINNEILVDSEVNGDKKDSYPINPDIQAKMREYWKRLNKIGLISDEKYKRLTRTTHFTDDEKFEFINRQLVETRQSTKAVATLLQELYPEAEIVYVKAGLVSDFRQQFGLPKSRAVNDLHHAKDAYLNIVAGNVWHCKFSRQFWHAEENNNAKPKVVFTHPVKCNGIAVWNGASDKDRVVKIARKNTAHVTMYSYCKKGQLFDQQPCPKGKNLVPLKKGRLTEIYGGYNKPTVAGFILVRYTKSKKAEVTLLPLRLMYMEQYTKDKAFREQYIKGELGDKAKDFEILLNGRILKINTVLSLDGAQYCIKGISGSTVLIRNMMQFKTSFENEEYIKHLESFDNKKKKNPKIKLSEKYDKISNAKNLDLYDCFVEKMQSFPYKYRPNNPYQKLKDGRGSFEKLDVEKQVTVLLSLLGLFGKADTADLTDIKGDKYAGKASLNLNISNWEKNYTDVRIIDRSASGLFEEASDNLLALL